jgi:hypothetical protein
MSIFMYIYQHFYKYASVSIYIYTENGTNRKWQLPFVYCKWKMKKLSCMTEGNSAQSPSKSIFFIATMQPRTVHVLIKFSECARVQGGFL